MLNNPDIMPSASVNRWIVSILTFHFELRHVPGKQHGPDGLSRCPPQPGNNPSNDEGKGGTKDFEDWIDNLYGFMHMVNSLVPASRMEGLTMALAGEVTLSRPYGVPDAQLDEPNYDLIPRGPAMVRAESADK